MGFAPDEKPKVLTKAQQAKADAEAARLKAEAEAANSGIPTPDSVVKEIRAKYAYAVRLENAA